jgi:hypothetical protein
LGFGYVKIYLHICFLFKAMAVSDKSYLKRKAKTKLLPVNDYFQGVAKNTSSEKIYRAEFNKAAFCLSLLGATDVQMSQAFGVAQYTLENWKRVYPDFLAAIQQGKLEADSKVAHSLYNMATGYIYTDTVVLTNRVKKYKNGKLVQEYTEPLLVKVEKQSLPNVNAAKTWLASRKPEIWGNKLHIEGKIDVSHSMDLTKFSIEELELLNRLGVTEQQPKALVENTSYEEVG